MGRVCARDAPRRLRARFRSMADFAEVRFKGTRKDYFAYEALDLVPGVLVIVEADRGEDLGEITSLGSIAERKCATSGACSTPLPELRVLRVAREAECVRIEELRADETRVRTETRKLVGRHKLNMKVTEAEWQFDKNKLIIYFTAERRVDFRELVRAVAAGPRLRAARERARPPTSRTARTTPPPRRSRPQEGHRSRRPCARSRRRVPSRRRAAHAPCRASAGSGPAP